MVLLTFLEAGEATAEHLSADSNHGDDVVRGLREKLRQAELRADSTRDDCHLAKEPCDVIARSERVAHPVVKSQ